MEYRISSETCFLYLTPIKLTYISNSQAAPSEKCSHRSAAMRWQINSDEDLALTSSFFALELVRANLACTQDRNDYVVHAIIQIHFISLACSPCLL